jgi:hypothetical protein
MCPEGTISFEMSGTIYPPILHTFPEDLNLQQHYSEKLKSFETGPLS